VGGRRTDLHGEEGVRGGRDMNTTEEIKERLEYLRGEIVAERISYGGKMNSRDIERRIEKICKDIGDLHEELIQSGETAWLTNLPALDIRTQPNTNDLEFSFKIGRSDEA
jgi:diphthamide synthase (EF-2-diphthine--ammonia ligase)